MNSSEFKSTDCIFPSPLKKDDKIVVLSPAGSIESKHVHKAVEVLRNQGWNAVIMPHALGTSGTYSGSDFERLNDLENALSDPEVKAIICSRGGYGAVHLLEQISSLPIRENPKWLVGFSDISALHALMASKGIVSVHAPMTKDIALGAENPDNAMLFSILAGEKPVTKFEASGYDRPGVASGRLLGGNLSVIADLIGTPFNVLQPDTILFIEDIAEPIYKIERIMYQLKLAGVLPKLKGLIVGQFTDYKGNANYELMEEMISDMVSPYRYPVAMNVPVGHVEHNVPVISGAFATLRVAPRRDSSLVYW